MKKYEIIKRYIKWKIKIIIFEIIYLKSEN